MTGHLRSILEGALLWCGFLCLGGCVVTPLGGPGTPPRTAVVALPKTTTPEDSGPAEIAASHVLVQYAGAMRASPQITRTKEEALTRAKEALGRARAGESFPTLVAEYSDEPGAKEREGALGRFDRRAMVAAFSNAAFKLKVGEISEIVETPFGFHIILRSE